MNGRFRDIVRQGRVLIRNIRYSNLFTLGCREELCRVSLEQVYKITNRLLHDLGVEYWLVYGTLLGYYRNGRLIRGDLDVDLGAHEKEYETIWQARHQLPDGSRMYDISREHYGPMLHVAYNGWRTDIYFYTDIYFSILRTVLKTSGNMEFL